MTVRHRNLFSGNLTMKTKNEFHLCPEVPDFLFHRDKTHALSKRHNSQHKSKHPAQSSDWEWSKCCTSHRRLSTALGNVGGKSQLDQVHLPILNEEKLALFQWPEWHAILCTVTTNNLKERKDFIKVEIIKPT